MSVLVRRYRHEFGPTNRAVGLVYGHDLHGPGVLDAVHAEFINVLGSARSRWASWQEAWNVFIGPQQRIRVLPHVCQECRGRRYATRYSASFPYCGSCHGTGTNRSPLFIAARPAPLPAANDTKADQ